MQSSTPSSDKIRENRLRKTAKRRGLLLVKSRRRDKGALDYGLYVLIEKSQANSCEASSAFYCGDGKTLDQIEAKLAAPLQQ